MLSGLEKSQEKDNSEAIERLIHIPSFYGANQIGKLYKLFILESMK